jgi:hypothetical protein
MMIGVWHLPLRYSMKISHPRRSPLVIVTNLDLLEANLNSGRNLPIAASSIEFFQFQGFEKTLMQEGGDLEVWLTSSKVESRYSVSICVLFW